MVYEYNDLEKEFLSTMLSDIAWEHRVHGDMKSDDFAWRVFQKLDYTIKQILSHKNKKFITILDSISPEKRGKEECDCGDKLGKCGCKVKDFNEAVDEIRYSLNLWKEEIERDN